MRTTTNVLIFRSLLAVAVLLSLVGVATADPVILNANVTGTFSQGGCRNCAAGGGSSSAASVKSVADSGTSTIQFSPVTTGFGTPLGAGQSINVTLGMLQGISTVPVGTSALDRPSFAGATFTLEVTFTVTDGAGLNPVTFTGALTGRFAQTFGDPQIEWLSPTTLTFNLPDGGAFNLTLPDSTDLIKCGFFLGGPSIKATITFTGGPPNNGGGSMVPEPATLLLLGAGLCGAVGLSRWKKKGAPKANQPS